MMIEFLFIYQLARSPLQSFARNGRVFARRWVCRNFGHVPAIKRQLCQRGDK
jgi:hypothetical protein